MRTTDVMNDIADDLEQLYGAGYRYVFIDEYIRYDLRSKKLLLIVRKNGMIETA